MKMRKKILNYISLLSLTGGVSLILGFLSFGGVLALAPGMLPILLPLASVAFVLSTAYEGKIYYQHLERAFKKLFSTDYLKETVAKQALLKYFPDATVKNRPQFFVEYDKESASLKEYQSYLKTQKGDKRFAEREIARLEKELKRKRKFFARLLFDEVKARTQYEQDVLNWINSTKTKSKISLKEKYTEKLRILRVDFNFIKAYSLLAGVIMGIGTTYMWLDVIGAVTWLAAAPWLFSPFVIIPVAIIAGAAWGLLTYNTVTEMFENKTLKKWYTEFKKNYQDGNTLKAFILTFIGVIALASMATLTVFTAGTWFSLVSKTAPVFAWMQSRGIPMVLAIANVVVTGAAELMFALGNISETMEVIKQLVNKVQKIFKKGVFDFLGKNMQEFWEELRGRENYLQIFNPFRITFNFLYTFLRVGGFLGHLAAIAMTADRFPNVPAIIAACLAAFDEFLQDLHYFFFGHLHSHPHGQTETQKRLEKQLGAGHCHSHDDDPPTKLIFLLLSPLMLISTLWNWGASQFNDGITRPVLSFEEALANEMGEKPVKAAAAKPNEEEQSLVRPKSVPVSEDWRVHSLVNRIENYKEKHLSPLIASKSTLAEKKLMGNLQKRLYKLSPSKISNPNPVKLNRKERKEELAHKIRDTKKVVDKRFSFFSDQTSKFLDKLSPVPLPAAQQTINP